MASEHAVVLFAHGARDPRWAEPLHALRTALQARMPASAVGTAFLELQAPALGQALEDLGTAGVRRIDILPVFWGIGGHVATDLPALVDRFRADHPAVAVTVLPVLSDLPGMIDFIAEAVSVAARG